MQIKTTDGSYNVASQGVGGAGLGLGIAGTALGLLGGNLNGILGGRQNGECADTRQISFLQAELAKEKSERYADGIGIATFKEAQALFNKNNELIMQIAQAVNNLDKQASVAEAINAERINCISNRVSALEGLTKLVVPNSSVCPGWGDVTVTPATTPTTAG